MSILAIIKQLAKKFGMALALGRAPKLKVAEGSKVQHDARLWRRRRARAPRLLQESRSLTSSNLSICFRLLATHSS